MKIDACLILKNEEEYVKKLIDNLLKFCDDIYLVDTGSTDNTINIINMAAMMHPNIHLDHFDWIDDFGAARNYSFELSKDSDYRFWCDASDDFSQPLIDKLIEFKNGKYSEKLYDAYSIDRIYGLGNVRIIGLTRTEAGIKWNDRIHEYLKLNGKTFNGTLFSGECTLIHKGVYNRKPGHENRNIKIFRSMDENHDKFSSRNLLYYGNELFDHKHYTLAYSMYLMAAKNYDNFLGDAELITIFCKLRVCYDENNKQDFGFKKEIIDFGRKLYNRGLRHKLMLYILATFYFEKEDWFTAIRLYKEAINLKKEQATITELIGNEISIENCLLQLVVSYDKLGDMNTSKYYNDLLLKDYPNNKSGKHNDEYFKKCLFDSSKLTT